MIKTDYCSICPSSTDCEKDFCYGVKESNKIRIKENRDKAVNKSLEYFDRHGFKYSNSKIPNVVILDYYSAGQFMFSLKNFSIKIDNNWIIKKKSKLLNNNSNINFGKYMNKKLSEINDIKYIDWLLTKSDILIHPDYFIK